MVLHDKEAIHQVPDQAASVPIYEFEVNFSDDEDYDNYDAYDSSDKPNPIGGHL